MDTIENFMNALTDMDLTWYPFLFLRPEQNEKMTPALVARMSVFFGVTYGILLYLLWVFLRHPFSWVAAAGFCTIMIVAFFILYLPTFAYFWNRRASPLQQESRQR